MTIKSRQKMIEAKQRFFANGGNVWNKDIKLSEKHRESAIKNLIPGNTGLKHTETSKQKIREKNKGKHYSPNTEFKKGIKSIFWQGGKSFEPYSTDWTKTLKRAIRERNNYICQLCSQYGNAVHHIDYDKKNCNLENLITLCVSCNSKVNFNRNYWINYFKSL